MDKIIILEAINTIKLEINKEDKPIHSDLASQLLDIWHSDQERYWKIEAICLILDNTNK